MALKTIRLELARTKETPDGDPGHAYEFRAPLDEKGLIDGARFNVMKDLCTVHRFEKGVEQETGILIRTKGGGWSFSYAPGEDDDEALFGLSTHKFKPGEYVSITEHDGEQRAFRVTTVKDWHPPQK